MGRGFWIVVAAFALGLALLIFTDGSTTLGLESDDLGSLVYLGILGGVIAVGVLSSGRRFGDTARMLGGWLLVILLLVAGYEYRYELQDVASRVSGGVVPPSPLNAVGGETVTLTKRSDGHFTARLVVNDVRIDALVDTGASTTVLTAEDAARAGFLPGELRFTIPVSTANGVANAARVVADTLAIGGIERGPMPVFVAEPGRLGQSLLGMSFIGTLSGFDLRGDRLILRD